MHVLHDPVILLLGVDHTVALPPAKSWGYKAIYHHIVYITKIENNEKIWDFLNVLWDKQG